MNFSGMPVVTSEWLTEPEDRTVNRTWRERLLTRPWRPWQRTKVITVQVPSRRVWMLPSGKLMVHPAMVEELRKLGDLGRIYKTDAVRMVTP